MPLIVNTDLKAAYEEAWRELLAPAAVKSAKLGQKFGNAMMKGFEQVKFNFAVTGVVPGPSPYSAVEIVKGSFVSAGLVAEISDGYNGLWGEASKGQQLVTYINKESKFIGKAMENFFTASIYQPMVHTAPPITKTPLQASVIENMIKSQLMAIYAVDSVGLQSSKAASMGLAIQNAIMTAIPMVSGNAPVSSPPTGSGTGVLF